MHTSLTKNRLSPAGFSLIELLIVIGLLGALTTLVLSTVSTDRTEIIDDSVVQKDLADIQAAFQRFSADCIPNESDYEIISRYGLEILMSKDQTDDGVDVLWDEDSDEYWSFYDFPQWDNDKRRGWRGPYIASESDRETIVTDTSGFSESAQQVPNTGVTGGDLVDIKVIETPYANDNDDDRDWGVRNRDFYRVIPEFDDDGDFINLWIVFPSHDNGNSANDEVTLDNCGAKRRLTLR